MSRPQVVFKVFLLLCAPLIATPLFAQTPLNLTSWGDLDVAVANAYSGLSNQVVIFPPCQLQCPVDGGYFTFTPGDLSAISNLCPCSTQFNVPVWQMTVTETQTPARAWTYAGLHGSIFRTNACPLSYDPTQWVNTAYGQAAPANLSGDDLTTWYAERDRDRFVWNALFVRGSDWSNMQVAAWATTTNPPASNRSLPLPPVDTNLLEITGIQLAGPSVQLWIYTPSNRPVAILGCPALIGKTNQWSVLGSMTATAPYTLWHSAAQPQMIYRVAVTDVDSDFDRIPDALEIYVYGMNPHLFDSDLDGASDFVELFINNTDPNNPDDTPPSAALTTPSNNDAQVWVP